MRWTVKSTSFEALISPTVTDRAPLHLRVCLLVDVVASFSPRTYIGCRREASAFLPASLAVVELFAANSPNAFLWSFSTAARTALRVSGESHSGLASQLQRRIKKGRAHKTGPRLARVDHFVLTKLDLLNSDQINLRLKAARTRPRFIVSHFAAVSSSNRRTNSICTGKFHAKCQPNRVRAILLTLWVNRIPPGQDRSSAHFADEAESFGEPWGKECKSLHGVTPAWPFVLQEYKTASIHSLRIFAFLAAISGVCYFYDRHK